jgi:large subunit ribosomal protein L6
MSRVGKLPVALPQGVSADLKGQDLKVKGPKGELVIAVHPSVEAKIENNSVVVSPRDEERQTRALWATMRARINNMVAGVHNGFEKSLEIEGVGYRCQLQGKDLVLQLGFSHEVRYPVPQGITIVVEKPTSIKISGVDKQQVGQVAAELRKIRPPEPYKGKGVRYTGEHIVRKEGKKK